MKFSEVVDQAAALLERKERLSYRALKREFELDDSALEDLKDELIDIQALAADKDGKMLVWVGEARSAKAVIEPRPESPASYTPKHLAEKILQSRSALEGERKEVTVLFADVTGSMELAGQLDAEDWHGILDRFFGILTEGVHRFEGTINQYTGDGMMALFGAPIAHEDHAQRACYAAIILRDELRQFADRLRDERGLNFGVRLGINSGDAALDDGSRRAAARIVRSDPPLHAGTRGQRRDRGGDDR